MEVRVDDGERRDRHGWRLDACLALLLWFGLPFLPVGMGWGWVESWLVVVVSHSISFPGVGIRLLASFVFAITLLFSLCIVFFTCAMFALPGSEKNLSSPHCQVAGDAKKKAVSRVLLLCMIHTRERCLRLLLRLALSHWQEGAKLAS